MNVAYIVTAILLSAVLVFSARNKLVREKEVTAILTRLGVPERMFAVLATLQLLGAAGLLIGIFFRPLGVAAATGVGLFFVGAVITHLKAGDVKGTPVPAALTAFSVVPLVLGTLTL